MTKKVIVHANNAWFDKVEGEVEKGDNFRQRFVDHIREKYNYSLSLDEFSTFVILEMTDRDATWFSLNWGGTIVGA